MITTAHSTMEAHSVTGPIHTLKVSKTPIRHTLDALNTLMALPVHPLRANRVIATMILTGLNTTATIMRIITTTPTPTNIAPGLRQIRFTIALKPPVTAFGAITTGTTNAPMNIPKRFAKIGSGAMKWKTTNVCLRPPRFQKRTCIYLRNSVVCTFTRATTGAITLPPPQTVSKNTMRNNTSAKSEITTTLITIITVTAAS